MSFVLPELSACQTLTPATQASRDVLRRMHVSK